ncbi:short-chain dehydrogenase/reductase family 9C member 7-like isoform X2 [Babylonia areolata]|uniref:short-chain dehydrogenase/reductase family 9C member 7-like isoform X2 n=1 Tax=Babylonia areolata TaxID=304850 RepID=UPI003FD0365A
MLWTLVALCLSYRLVTWALSCIRIKDYADQGFSVFATCLTSEGAKNLQQQCSERVTSLVLDVTDENSITNARQFVESKLPAGKGLWGLVNNAGVAGTQVPSEWLTPDDWHRCLSVNLFGVVNTTRVFLPLLRQGGGGGRVVNMASMMGRIAATAAPYSVSKFGVEAFSDVLRFELRSQGIKVCLVEPGYFKTDILSLPRLVSEFKDRYDSVPDDIKRHYEYLNVEKFTRLLQKLRDKSSGNVHLVVNAVELALTSRFPPTRQLVGNDARIVARILWNLPTPVMDWILQQALRMG